MEVNLEKAFENIVLVYKKFGTLLPDEHKAMEMSFKVIHEALFPKKKEEPEVIK